MPSVEPVAKRPVGGIDGFSRWFIETVVGSNDGGELDRILAPEIAAWLTRDRIQRLHTLFPGFGMVVNEVLAQEEKALVRYTVACHDQSGLVGPAGDRLLLRQAVILELDGGLVARIDPLIDDFALWKLPSPGNRTT
ncbi:MAG: nuclear transport factor 2 family protein [Candidatus Sphingomonas phytovorans]|nr:nuclear transport factor 2 family protein [Sphingomonas sp.]WEK02310.1 MAG: nuclear transport factor 2 family protein [Sphingomonas sp.]